MEAGTNTKREIEWGEDNRGNCRDGGDREEQEEVDNISFHLGATVDRDAVKPPPPRP